MGSKKEQFITFRFFDNSLHKKTIGRLDKSALPKVYTRVSIVTIHGEEVTVDLYEEHAETIHQIHENDANALIIFVDGYTVPNNAIFRVNTA